MSPSKRVEVILSITMGERPSYNNHVIGQCEAHVYAYAPDVGYEQLPTRTLYTHESVWAGFAAKALYGNPEIDEGRPYGFEYGYAAEYRLVGTYEVQRFAKGLGKVDKAYEKICTTYGRPQSLGRQVIYLMQAVGIKYAVWKLPAGQEGSQYREWRLSTSMGDIEHYVDNAVADLCERQAAKHAA